MQKFRLRQDAFKELRKKMLMRTVPLLVVAMAAGLFISTINSKDKAGDTNVLPIVIPTMFVVVFFSLFNSTKKQKALLESYTLTISDVSIKREQLNTQTVAISPNDIQAIIKNKDGAFVVMGKEKYDLLDIPSQIENYNEVEQSLQKLCAITVRENTPTVQKYQLLLGLLPIGLMICVFTLTNKIIVAISGTAFIGIVVWGLVMTKKNKNIDNKTKRGMWWALLVVGSVVAIMYFKITGMTPVKK